MSNNTTNESMGNLYIDSFFSKNVGRISVLYCLLKVTSARYSKIGYFYLCHCFVMKKSCPSKHIFNILIVKYSIINLNKVKTVIDFLCENSISVNLLYHFQQFVINLDPDLTGLLLMWLNVSLSRFRRTR